MFSIQTHHSRCLMNGSHDYYQLTDLMVVYFPLRINGFIMSICYQDTIIRNRRVLESLRDIIVTKLGDLVFVTP